MSARGSKMSPAGGAPAPSRGGSAGGSQSQLETAQLLDTTGQRPLAVVQFRVGMVRHPAVLMWHGRPFVRSARFDEPGRVRTFREAAIIEATEVPQ